MLSDEEMRRIEEEELAVARARQAEEERARHQLALHAYREEVRAVLLPQKAPGWRPALWLLPLLAVLAGVLLLRPAPAGSDDTSGGIATSALLDRCREEVGTRLGQPGLRFPGPREAAGQISANADGKRWDGWVATPGNSRTDFSCSFTAADQSVQVELIQEEKP
ncbi:hypothetical protein E5F05_19315 [Deinococcus metallilatus]|uniref:Uncharacterized protein n=1 Tax=Deinococcus metallilatus TaxID=1211322 RepID=A0AAJ5F1F1_9DEIO|nr:hypothetical protein [Deinococcus metallilatus]MBB5296430.1 hypothetical protein [Deinococcus metallilatus]QBY09900.1 hypothetical protein E5F05_19315 [Deinococcus metallilatus]RXJ08624.1 hypothetical protein ERJ73_18155 [Deinococcus metallilatus]TLK25098.1 hypothetical protein FCS05_13070 [Deinococcus metallilatus]GMA14657.1 hypothetical protein GCM10025871_09880 [Deinococcus metallilatus]